VTTAVEVGNLPVALTELVGREHEQRQLTDLLSSNRLVTVCGTGGCGKTRLALAVAGRLRDDYPDGAWWVDLAATSGREVPVQAVVRTALGIPQSAEDSAQTLATYLRDRRALLVLDNCEHVVNECAALTDLLLRRAAELAILATSREVLGVPGERVFRLAGLRLGRTLAERAASEAVRLFVQRARTAAPDLELGEDDLRAAARLCAQLDGLPLAIELAAARVAVLGVSEIAERLERDVGLLRHPSRTAPARQQTLAATLDWSHGLLAPLEQVMFRRLACFRGSFSLLAAETVASDGAAVDRRDVLDLLATLVDKSLVQVADRGAEHRYRMLETVRQYGESRLAASEDELAVRSAHAEFYLELALRAQAGLDGPDQVRWLDRLELENDNVRAALEWSLVRHPETGCRLAAALWPFWYRRGHYNEGRFWLEEAVEVAGAASEPVRAATLTAAGILAFFQCDYALALDRLGAARAVYEDVGDQIGLATVLQRLGGIAREQARYAEARTLHESARALYAGLGDEVAVAVTDDYLGFAAWLAGDAERARELCSGALATLRRYERRQETAAALVNLGVAALLLDDEADAVEWLTEALTISEEVGYPEGEAWSLHELAVATAPHDPARARSLLERSLRRHVELGDRWRVASVLETAAWVLRDGEPRLCARLLGAASVARDELGAPVPPVEAPNCEVARSAAVEALGRTAADEAVQLGRRTSLERAVELALSALAFRADRGGGASEGAGGGTEAAAGGGSEAAAGEGSEAGGSGAGGSAAGRSVAGGSGAGGSGAAAGGGSGAGASGAVAAGGGSGAGGEGAGGEERGRPAPRAAALEVAGGDRHGLTDRELAVLRLVARGLTNREIGAELFISAGTAGVHVSNILRKLGVSGRVQAAGIAHEMGLTGTTGLTG
jgi:predicted ATPase/DNA-binding CsgD family transcriptional regulator